MERQLISKLRESVRKLVGLRKRKENDESDSPLTNICLEYLSSSGEKLEKYWARCDRLADNVASWAEREGREATPIMIYRRGTNKNLKPRLCICNGVKQEVRWSHHVVVEVNGLIHDAWHPDLLPVDEYIQANFGHHQEEIQYHPVYR